MMTPNEEDALADHDRATEDCGPCNGRGKTLVRGAGIQSCPWCDGTGKAVIVTKDEARHVLYYLGKPGGFDGGGFVHSLLRTIQQADPDNVHRLRRGFPGYVFAMKIWSVADLTDYVNDKEPARA